jgi:hypothetical protein
MEEELHMLRDVYKTAARANLAQEAFWQNMSVHYGFVPEPVPPELLELSRLSAANYSPNLGEIPDDRSSHVCWLSFAWISLYLWEYSTLFLGGIFYVTENKLRRFYCSSKYIFVCSS